MYDALFLSKQFKEGEPYAKVWIPFFIYSPFPFLSLPFLHLLILIMQLWDDIIALYEEDNLKFIDVLNYFLDLYG